MSFVACADIRTELANESRIDKATLPLTPMLIELAKLLLSTVCF